MQRNFISAVIAVCLLGLPALAASHPKSTASMVQVVTANPVANPPQPVKATVALYSVSNPASTAGSVNVVVVVQGVAGGPIPSGTVTLSSNGQAIFTNVPLGANGMVECTQAGPVSGSYPILATYNGDAHYY